MKMWMFWLGMFLMAMGAGTSDSNLNRFSFLLGAVLGIIGVILMFFSFKEHRNPLWIKRQVFQRLKGYLN